MRLLKICFGNIQGVRLPNLRRKIVSNAADLHRLLQEHRKVLRHSHIQLAFAMCEEHDEGDCSPRNRTINEVKRKGQVERRIPDEQTDVAAAEGDRRPDGCCKRIPS